MKEKSSSPEQNEETEGEIGSIISESYYQSQGEDFPKENGGFRISENLVVTQNPNKFVLSEKDGEFMGLNIYTDAPETELAPNRHFISGNHPGNVATKEELCRGLRSERTSPMLIGDAGTAKNTSIYSVYSTLGQPVYRVQMSDGYTVHDIVASTQLRNGNTVTQLKQIGLAAVFGGAVVIDEINLATKRLLGHLNSIVEEKGNRRVSLPGSGVTLSDLPEAEVWNPKKHLGRYIHPEFRVIATRNPPSYTGAGMINNALTDRFSPIRYEYPSTEDEATLISEDLGVDVDNIIPLVKVVNKEIRNARKNNEGPMCPISYRRLSDTVEYAACHGTTLYQAAKAKIMGYAQSQADRDFIQGAIEDNKVHLNKVVSSDSTRLCPDCQGDLSGNMICNSCNRPFYESDFWETDFKSDFVGSFALSQNDTVLISIWKGPDSELYEYPDVGRKEYEVLCEGENKPNSSIGKIYNKAIKRQSNSKKLGRVEDDKPPTIV